MLYENSYTLDLTPLFHWNTKQLFLYLEAEYTNSQGVRLRSFFRHFKMTTDTAWFSLRLKMKLSSGIELCDGKRTHSSSLWARINICSKILLPLSSA